VTKTFAETIVSHTFAGRLQILMLFDRIIDVCIDDCIDDCHVLQSCTDPSISESGRRRRVTSQETDTSPWPAIPHPIAGKSFPL
jgi:hypothetical protein